ncbi:MAG: tryptophan 7-halogenase [Acetobacteraceae bacterium]|nr:tryptophan 7-halogenase [Acetobacteraceae bacterium]
MDSADVVIIGAGPAGAAAALNLAPMRHVVLVERRANGLQRTGEALPPVARRLFADMGLLAEFLAEGHLPCHGNRSVWGTDKPIETDFLRDLDGHGWHLDRTRFDDWLRRAAVKRGATPLMPARFDAIEREGARWRVRVVCDNGPAELSTPVVIDCGGRRAPAARRLGAQRQNAGERLVCAWALGTERSGNRGAGFTVVEAVEDGWWYTAPVPGRRRVLALFTDADLIGKRLAGDGAALVRCAMATCQIGPLMDDAAFRARQGGLTAAHHTFLDACSGLGWIAAGDASISFDPISSQGLLHALFSGLSAAEAAERYLTGAPDALDLYQRVIHGVKYVYASRVAAYYATETRWAAAPFWQRRRVQAELF